MRDFVLLWTIENDRRTLSDALHSPNWSDIDQKLDVAALAETGFVRVELISPPAVGPQGLEVWCAGGKFELLLGEVTEEGHNVRLLNERYLCPASRVPPLYGDFFPSGPTCNDFTLVKRAFKEFAETGDVSHDLLA